jgi:hypothetical protein
VLKSFFESLLLVANAFFGKSILTKDEPGARNLYHSCKLWL